MLLFKFLYIIRRDYHKVLASLIILSILLSYGIILYILLSYGLNLANLIKKGFPISIESGILLAYALHICHCNTEGSLAQEVKEVQFFIILLSELVELEVQDPVDLSIFGFSLVTDSLCIFQLLLAHLFFLFLYFI